MRPTTYKFEFAYGEPFKEIVVDHDPEETGIDVESEYRRYMEIGELQSGCFRPTTTDFRNFLWSELGLMTITDKPVVIRNREIIYT
tara:strand:+ start:152 stop:409 length:258 start_codon:yes stop_codon:yes gene_type:complete